jgi:hypothetical protein
MIKVCELVPGMRVNGLKTATFVAQTEHPIWQRLQLVIWKVDEQGWSLDALDYQQVVGEAVPSTLRQRQENLRRALTGEP